MPSLKGLAVGVGAVIAVGYLALRTKAGTGLSSLATGIVQTISAPLVGVGGGLKILGEGVSAFLSPTIAPTIAPKFDWSGWNPFPSTTSNGTTNGNGTDPTTPMSQISKTRTEDRPAGVRPPGYPKTTPILPATLKRSEDRTVSRTGGIGSRAFIR